MNHRKMRGSRILAGVSMAAVIGVLTCATSASAHVTVHPDTVAAGSGDVELTFRVPNEHDNADTVRLQVFLPSNFPLLTVDVLPIPGWSAKVDTQALSKPVETDDGPVSAVVRDITWIATAGGIAPGQYQDFDISVGKVPDHTGTAAFKSLQTYSSGEVVRWIQVADSQDPNPDTPAPTLTLANPRPLATASADTSPSSSTSEGIAVAALALACIALLGVAALLVRGRRRPAATADGATNSGTGTGARPGD